ncbi:unnamed protein product [Closterium sp. Yama58-4]|nr:unnamed protein product [Closterium sp. Yama58-4]
MEVLNAHYLNTARCISERFAGHPGERHLLPPSSLASPQRLLESGAVAPPPLRGSSEVKPFRRRPLAAMRVQCDVCERHAAVLICCADEAALCAECDRRVHAANKVAKQHQRVPIGQPDPAERPVCDICQEKPAFFFCVEDRAILCRACDVAIHLPNSLSARHRRFLLPNGRVALEALPADVSLPQPPPTSPFACALAASSPHSASAFNPAAASAPRPHPLAPSLAASAASPLPRPSAPASAVAPRPPASPPSRSASAAAVAVVPSSPTPPTNTAHAQARAAAATAAAAPTVPVAGIAGAAPSPYRSSRKGNSAFASNPAPQGASRRAKADWGSSLATANHTAPGQLPGHVYAGSGASSLAGRSPAGFGGSGGSAEFSFPSQAAVASDAATGLEGDPGKGRMGAGADALASNAEGAGAPSQGGRGGGGGGAAWAGEGGGLGGGGEMGGGEGGLAGECETAGAAEWRVEELLNIPELAGGYTLADVGSSKAEAHDLGDFDWTADLSLFDEQMYAESLHEVPQIAPSAAAAAGPSSPFSTAFSLMAATPPLPPTAPAAAAAGPSTAAGTAGAGGGAGGVFVGMGGRARGAAAAAAAASAMLPDADDCFVVPDVAAPVPSAPPAKRRRGIV